MRLTNRIKQAGATGYILLWLLGIPIPILLLIFLLGVARKDFGSGPDLLEDSVRAKPTILTSHI
jgi:hypothetical protein